VPRAPPAQFIPAGNHGGTQAAAAMQLVSESWLGGHHRVLGLPALTSRTTPALVAGPVPVPSPGRGRTQPYQPAGICWPVMSC